MIVALAKYRTIILNTLSNHIFHTYGRVVGLILATCFLVYIYKLKLTLINSTVIACLGLLHDQCLQNTFLVINIIIKPVTLNVKVNCKPKKTFCIKQQWWNLLPQQMLFREHRQRLLQWFGKMYLISAETNKTYQNTLTEKNVEHD